MSAEVVRQNGTWPRAAPVVAALAVLCVYLPSVLRRSAWSDDYPILFETNLSSGLSRGRPVSTALQILGFQAAGSIDGLRFLRILGLLGTVALVWWIARFLLVNGLQPASAALFAISTGFLPTFHFSVGWATVFLAPWQCLLAAIAGILWVDAEGGNRFRHRMVAGFCLTFLLLSYPPSAMFCWAVLAVRLTLRRDDAPTALRQVISMGVLVTISSCLSLLTIAGLSYQIENGDPHLFRFVGSLPEFAEKLVWFVSHPVVVGARPFSTFSPSPILALVTAGPVLIVIAAGLYLSARGSTLGRLAAVALVGLSSALTMTSHLVASDNQIDYRFMTGLTVSMWILLLLSVKQVAQSLMGTKARRSLPVVGLVSLLLVTVLFAVTARTSIDRLFLKPFDSKETYLLDHLVDFDETRHNQVVLITPTIWPSRSRLGVFSTVTDLSHPWVLRPNIQLLLQELGVEDGDISVLVVDHQPSLEITDYGIDLRPYVAHLE